ncbi:hypothetical protein Nmel_001411 [Mimus melanotis]
MVCVPSRVSQNRTIGQVGRDHSGSSQSTWHRIESRRLLNISSEGYIPHSLSGKCVPVLSQVSEFLPIVSCLTGWHHREEPGSILWATPHLYFYRGIYIYIYISFLFF